MSVMPQKTAASLFLSERSRNDPSLLLEAVPHSALRHDQLRIRRVFFELLTQVTDVHVDGALVAVLRVTEHVLEQLRAREDPTGLAREREQDLEFEEGELDRLVVPLDGPLGRIDPEAVVQERIVDRV